MKKILFFVARLIVLSISPKKDPVGGQAIIEGVMMRSKNRLAVAVRRANGEIVRKSDPHTSWKERSKILSIPVIRGAVTFIESMVVGMKTLSYSADIAMMDEQGKDEIKKTFKDHFFSVLTLVFSFAVATALFMYTPLFLAKLLNEDLNPIAFNAVAGFIRITFLVLYIVIISRMKDVQRVFQYHGAEHKAIFNHESGEELSVENSAKQGMHHPRCGTSFLIIAGVSCIFIFAILDYFILSVFGADFYSTVFKRFLVHLPLIPVVSGISYEFLKLSDKYSDNVIIGKAIIPGLLLQKWFTTKEPDNEMLEVAICSIKDALKTESN